MYFKYRDMDGSNRIMVRDVQFFTVTAEEYEDENRQKRMGGAIVALDHEAHAEFADECIQCLCELLAERPQDIRQKRYYKLSEARRPGMVQDLYNDPPDDLAFYETFDEAQAAFEDICKALAEGQIFYDLTQHESQALGNGGSAPDAP